jgi:hypothetical protein
MELHAFKSKSIISSWEKKQEKQEWALGWLIGKELQYMHHTR